jgi:RHS repeat-associated protein
MATAEQLSENSHQGFDGLKAALCLGSMEAKSNTASGMPLCLRPNGIGSRSTGKERDAETGLDFFLARYYSGAQGRFTSVDPTMKSALASNPQSWNRYAYVMNNPLRYTDPFGLWAIKWEDDPEYKKTKKGTKVIHHWKVTAYKEKGDTIEQLAEMLGVKAKNLGKVGDGDIRLSELSSRTDAGRVFRGVESFLNSQDNPDARNASNCAQTAAQLGFANSPAMIGGLQPENMDSFLGVNAQPKSLEAARVGDIVRYAGASNNALHFTTFLYFENGVPQVFSQSGAGGSFFHDAATSFQGQQSPSVNYGTIQGIKKGESGYYRPE